MAHIPREEERSVDVTLAEARHGSSVGHESAVHGPAQAYTHTLTPRGRCGEHDAALAYALRDHAAVQVVPDEGMEHAAVEAHESLDAVAVARSYERLELHRCVEARPARFGDDLLLNERVGVVRGQGLDLGDHVEVHVADDVHRALGQGSHGGLLDGPTHDIRAHHRANRNARDKTHARVAKH